MAEFVDNYAICVPFYMPQMVDGYRFSNHSYPGSVTSSYKCYISSLNNSFVIIAAKCIQAPRYHKSRDSVVGITAAYRLDDCEVRVRIWEGQEFSHLHIQTGSEVHPTPLSNVYRGLKQPGREADHSPPASAEVKKMWIYTYAFMA
jgi:hypothetical protein